MNAAVAEHTVPHVPRAAVQATPVRPMGGRDELEQCRGIHILQAHAQLFGSYIQAHDVIEVDFDVRRIYCDAEYLIAYRQNGDYCWYGVRRFQFRPNGELWIATPEYPTGATWSKVSAKLQRDIEVFGIVREVFKPVSKTRSRT